MKVGTCRLGRGLVLLEISGHLCAQGDIQGMQEQVQVLGEQVAGDAEQLTEAVGPIAELDRVKLHMEGACSTLKEATELSSMFNRVEEVRNGPSVI